MKAFRIDKRDFKKGDIITPQGEYQNNLDDKKIRVEKLLEDERPDNKPKRNEILMLFKEFNDAKHFWTILKQSKFYKIEISENEILHIGDFNKVEELYMKLDNTENAKQIASEYWQGIFTEKPKLEIFMRNSKVEKVLSNSEEERKNAFAERAGLSRKGIKIIKNED